MKYHASLIFLVKCANIQLTISSLKDIYIRGIIYVNLVV